MVLTLEIIRTMLYLELDQMQERHKMGANLFGTWAKLAPAFGMTGTLIGLIALLGNLEDKSALPFLWLLLYYNSLWYNNGKFDVYSCSN